jgi:hypothetical protein
MMLRKAPKHVLHQIGALGRAARDHTVTWFNPPQRRLRLRRRLALYTAPVAALLGLVVAGLVAVVVVGNSVVVSFDRHDIDALRRDVEKLEKFRVIEPGSIAFARGDLLVLEGKLNEAEERFRDALDRFDGDSSCPVRINLELVQETLADLSVRSGRVEEAEQHYNNALTVVRDAPAECFQDNTDPNEDRRAVRADAQPRLERKLAALHAPPAPPPSGPAVVTSEPPPPPPPSPPADNSPAPGQGEGPGTGTGQQGPGQAPAPGQGPGQGTVEGQPPPAPGNAPALPPLGQGDGPSTPETPPLPPLPGENLPAPPPQTRSGEQPPSGGPGDGPLPVADPATPNPVQILGPVGADGLPLGDQNKSAPDLHLNDDRRRALSPADKLQTILEDANSYGGERE